MPDSMQAWLDKLAEQPLPVLAATRDELDQLIAQQQLSVVLYAQPVLRDPALAGRLLGIANQARIGNGRHALTTMANVVSHFGQAALQTQLQQCRKLDDLDLPERRRQGFLRYVAQACHAAHQAVDWARFRGANEPDEVQLAGLLQNLAELALWCYGDDTMVQIEQRVQVKKEAYEKAAQEVLGCSMRALSAALAERWQLSELTVDALRVTGSGFTLAHGVALASRLARISAGSWYNREAMQCLDEITRYQGRAVAEVETRLHQCALELTEEFVQRGYMPPARLLPMLVDEDYVDDSFRLAEAASIAVEPEPVAKPDVPEPRLPQAAQAGTERDNTSIKKTKSTGAETAAPGVVEAQRTVEPKTRLQPQDATTSPARAAETGTELARNISAIKTMINQRAPIQQLIQQVVDSILLLGFERVMFAIKVPKQAQLLAQFAAQRDDARPLKDLKMPVDNQHLFTRLLEKPQFLLMQESNRNKVLKMIPDGLAMRLNRERFVLGSVFNGKRPLGVMYADGFAKDLSTDQLKKFQGLCKMLSSGINEILSSKSA
jgi:HD-like signal output (HDOD) protein